MTDRDDMPQGYRRVCRRGHAVAGENAKAYGDKGTLRVVCLACRRQAGRGMRASVESEGGVNCLVCGDVLHTIVPHVRVHGLTTKEYRARFPGAPLTGSHFAALSREQYTDKVMLGRLPVKKGETCARGHRMWGGNIDITSDGRRRCRRCKLERTQRWRDAHFEQVREYGARRWRERVEEHGAPDRSEYMREYQAKNRGKLKKKAAARYLANREEIRQKQRAHYLANREAILGRVSERRRETA